MNLNVTWDNPALQPTCGYKVFFRRQAAPSYTILTTSGSTSGSTSVSIYTSAPANYEGYVQSDCCSGSTSLGDPFGVNSYVLVTSAVSKVSSPSYHYVATIQSAYPNPYDTYISGKFFTPSGSVGGTSYTVLYPSGSTSAVLDTGIPADATSGTTVTDTTITVISPVFNGGGSIQQYDAVKTPNYFRFVKAPPAMTLLSPSSLLQNAFIVTSIDSVTEEVLSGNLLFSYIAEGIYAGGVSPYNQFSLEVVDPADSVIIGSSTIVNNKQGLINTTILLNKSTSPLDETTLFTLNVILSNGTLGYTTSFYLPLASA